MKITLHLNDPEYERFTRTFQDSPSKTHEEFVMRAVDFIDRLRSGKEEVGAKTTLATLLVRNPKNGNERILEKY